MEPEPSLPQITGLNLDNYFPTKCSYDSVLYVHKKFLPKYNDKVQRKHRIHESRKKWDKCQQFDNEDLKKESYKIKEKIINNADKDPVVEQTIRFAKSLIPLTIPPRSGDYPHPEYTIKSIKKPKQISTNFNNNKSESIKGTYSKEKRKHVLDNSKHDKLKRPRDSISTRESVSSSQNNTLDDVNENRTLSCTLSEISEKKHHKEYRHCKRNKRNEMQKVAISESFEAVATEFMNTAGDTKIKIHLMNEGDKNLFTENIQKPVIGAIKECIMELNNANLKALQYMQTTIEHQTKKIEVILDKLSNFEEKWNCYKNDKISTTYAVASGSTKASKLEELSADILDVKEVPTSDEEEMGEIDLIYKNVQNKRVLKPTDKKALDETNPKLENLGCGENLPVQLNAQMGIKPDRISKVPTRYCWTDAGRNNN